MGAIAVWGMIVVTVGIGMSRLNNKKIRYEKYNKGKATKSSLRLF